MAAGCSPICLPISKDDDNALIDSPQQFRRWRAEEYGRAYKHQGGQRTSAMLERVMRGMNGYLVGWQHRHGSAEAAEQHGRAWALLFNFAPWGPETPRANGEWHSPAERFNRHRYHDNWLHNLFISASLGGVRGGYNPPQTP